MSAQPEPGSVAAALALAGPQSFKAWLEERKLSEIIEQAPKDLRKTLPRAVRLLATREALPAKLAAARKKVSDLEEKLVAANNAEATVEKSIRFLESLRKSLFDFEKPADSALEPPATSTASSDQQAAAEELY